MVVVLPLMVVGTVFAAYHSIDSTVKVGVAFVNGEKVTGEVSDIYATVKYGDEKSEEIKIVKGHTQTATVSAVYSKQAYTFEGWFMGDADAYAKAVENGTADLNKETDLTFNMSNTTDVVAVYSVHKFTISYTGAEAPASAATEVKYGDKLADPKSKDSMDEAKCYRGWVVSGDNTGARYKYATFNAEGPFTLENPLDNRKGYDLTLKNDGTEKTKKVYVEDQEGNPTDVDLNEELDLDTLFPGVKENGYTYSWEDEAGNVVNGKVPVTENTTYSLKKVAIEYNAHITLGNNITDTVDSNVSFTVEKHEAIDKLFTLKSKYSFFKIKQIVADGETYQDAKSFVNAFVAEHKDESATAEITVDSESRFTTITVSNGVQFNSKKEGEGANVFTGGVYNSTGSSKSATINKAEIKEDTLICKLFSILDNNGEIEDLYSDADHTKPVSLVGIQVFFNSDVNQRLNITLTSDLTVYDFMEAIINLWKTIDNNDKIEFPGDTDFEISQIKLLFA